MEPVTTVYVLRKSYEGLSSGTRIEFVQDIGEWSTGPNEVRHLVTVRFRNEEFDVDINDLVKLRDRPESVGPNKEPKKPRTTKNPLIVTTNRRQRRAADPIVKAKREAWLSKQDS